MRSASKGLHSLLPAIDQLVTSPYTRAVQTADIVARPYKLTPSRLAALKPGTVPRRMIEWLMQHPKEATIAIVGHEPDLGRLTGYLLTGQARSFIRYKKGAVALLEFDGPVRAGAATLAWLLTAAQLGDLG